jgi:hypothetical protein
MSTGVKTSDKAIGVDVCGNPLKHVGSPLETTPGAPGFGDCVHPDSF